MITNLLFDQILVSICEILEVFLSYEEFDEIKWSVTLFLHMNDCILCYDATKNLFDFLCD